MKNIITMIFCLWFTTFFQSCGNSTHTVEGVPSKIEVIHSIDFEAMKEIFIDDCTKEFDNQTEIDNCVSNKVDDLIDFINNYKDSEDE